VDFEGSEKCDGIAFISHFIFLTYEGKMKNVRCPSLNLQDFCLMWLIITVLDRNGIKTQKRGRRGGVLDELRVGGGCGCAAGAVVIP